MARSGRKKTAVIILLLLAAVLVAISLFQLFFMDGIYFRAKKKTITQGWNMIDQAEGCLPDDEFLRFCQVNGLEFCIADENMNGLYTNTQKAELMIGRLFGQVLGKEEQDTTVLAETDRNRMIRVHDRFQNMDFLELWGVLRNGNYFMIHSPVQSISEAASLAVRVSVPLILLAVGIGAAGILLAVRDLREANARLQRDIKEKTEAEKRSREFIANVSHELKTPIALIRGYAEGLRDGINEDEESREFYSEVIIDESEKMNHLVRQLLNLAQIESGKEPLAKDRFDLVGLIRGVMASSSLMIEKGGASVEISGEESLPVVADEFKIEEVVTNLLNNALHHLDGEKRIRFRCVKDRDIARVSIYNSGTQIPEEELGRIWEKFYKVDKSHAREYGGSGLGLSIVRAIVEAHGGTCEARNLPDGVEFSFTIPIIGDGDF